MIMFDPKRAAKQAAATSILALAASAPAFASAGAARPQAGSPGPSVQAPDAKAAAVKPKPSPPSVQPQAREKVAPAVAMRAESFPLEDVRLLDGPFKTAQQTDRAYMLQLDPDRLLSHMRSVAGLEPRAIPYGGWDRNGSGMAGHYLSAASFMAQATGDAEMKRRVAYIVAEMAAIQKANGDGSVHGFVWDKSTWFPALAEGKLIPVGVTPWYGIHKTMAGLRDAWLACGNAQARQVLVGVGDWAIRVTAKLSPEQWQAMLEPEHGGPHEVLADLFAITGERKYLQLAQKFDHTKVMEPLARGDETILYGRHANSEAAKFVAYERVHEMSGSKLEGQAALGFWEHVTEHHSWANGGNSQWEHFFNPIEFPKQVLEPCGPETCNTYNMLKLTRRLFDEAPSDRFVEYAERALYNHILTSEVPGEGGFAYYTSMRPGHYRVFSRPFDAFWCCVGTGMENHARYGEQIYARSQTQSKSQLWVNLFIPSILSWKEKSFTLRQETRFPEEARTRLLIGTPRPQRLTIQVRYPTWVQAGALRLSINGQAHKVSARPGSFIALERVWKRGDRVEIELPMRVHAEKLPHSDSYAAFFYGPILLAGVLGSEGLIPEDFNGGGAPPVPGQNAGKPMPLGRVPTLLGSPEQIAARLKPVQGKPLSFRTGDSAGKSVTMMPLYQLFLNRYAIYWPIADAAAFEKQQVLERARRVRWVDSVQPGDGPSEAAHNLQGQKSRTEANGWRDAIDGGFFSYDLKVLPDTAQQLVLTYWGSDAGRDFDVVVEGRVLASESLRAESPGSQIERVYELPADLIAGKAKITVRLQAKPGSSAGGIFGARVQKK